MIHFILHTHYARRVRIEAEDEGEEEWANILEIETNS